MTLGAVIADTMQDGLGNTVPMTTAISGSAKAWVNYNGTAGTIKQAFNVSSVTKNGTGDYTLNFTTAMTDANYSALLSVIGYAIGNVTVVAVIAGAIGTGPALKTTTQLRIQVGPSSGTGNYDATEINIGIFR